MASQVAQSPAAPALTALDTSTATTKHFKPTDTQPTSSHFTGVADASDAAVQSPSLSSQSARARFEFEYGRGNEGTKVLMVEWEDDAVTRRIRGTWHVQWDGKPADVMPVEDDDVAGSTNVDGGESDASVIAAAVEDEAYYSTTTTPSTAHSDASAVVGSNGKAQTSHRLFFLLGPRKNVPATVTLILVPDVAAHAAITAPKVEWKTNPLPAIFPRSLAESTGSWSSKGVLHGIWAQKRLAKLEKEIEEEAETNCEGIALHMAISEKEWIESNYGLGSDHTKIAPVTDASKSLSLDIAAADKSLASTAAGSMANPHSPLSPRSPGGSRIADKLKALKLQTTEQTISHQQQQQTRIMPILPSNPASFGSHSIGAILSDSGVSVPTSREPVNLERSKEAPVEAQEEEEQELFALPLSPRSPEMTKSPFSFAAADTRRYLYTK